MRKTKAYLMDVLLKLLPASVINEVTHRFMKDKKIFYSQEGEDIILERLFERQKSGFYIDIGSHHPVRFSNTFKFYERGWTGINVDATPESMKPFQIMRPKDINLELGVSTVEGKMDYFLFNEPALNTFSKDRCDFLLAKTDYKLIRTIPVITKSLQTIIKEYVPEGKKIDFLTIDVEGLDLEILKSNDWTKYRPGIVVAEDIGGSLENLSESGMHQMFDKVGYELIARTHNTVFYRNSQPTS